VTDRLTEAPGKVLATGAGYTGSTCIHGGLRGCSPAGSCQISAAACHAWALPMQKFVETSVGASRESYRFTHTSTSMAMWEVPANLPRALQCSARLPLPVQPLPVVSPPVSHRQWQGAYNRSWTTLVKVVKLHHGMVHWSEEPGAHCATPCTGPCTGGCPGPAPGGHDSTGCSPANSFSLQLAAMPSTMCRLSHEAVLRFMGNGRPTLPGTGPGIAGWCSGRS
jgi:hypothetical protein